jgi:triosephosphate isomerase (TIM)
MRRKLVAGNWKMNLTPAKAMPIVRALLETIDFTKGTEVVICPPYLTISMVVGQLKETHIQVGAQDAFWLPTGAFTGQVSAAMVKDAGCRYCIVGHSEARGRFGKLEIPPETVCHFADTDHTVGLKIGALAEIGVKPILCVGETIAERNANMTDAIISTQLQRALEDHSRGILTELVVAYEPVWAIGTGNVCDPVEAERVCSLIRSALKDIVGPDFAEKVRILYGGSVKSSNAGELFAQPNIDGGLVGGASLDPQEFAAIVAAA